MSFLDKMKTRFGGQKSVAKTETITPEFTKTKSKMERKMADLNLHPAINNGLRAGESNFDGATLKCHCDSDQVEVAIEGNVLFNHACGCSKCWKPEGALFSVVGVVPRDKLKVTAHEEKLEIVDKSAVIQRHACKKCGVHLYGRIEDKQHAFYGFDFIHAELFDRQGAAAPEFAAFVSSIIEQGFPVDDMGKIRGRFRDLELATYDVLAPQLMDMIAANNYKLAHATPAE